jgi:hypothetical protein
MPSVSTKKIKKKKIVVTKEVEDELIRFIQDLPKDGRHPRFFGDKLFTLLDGDISIDEAYAWVRHNFRRKHQELYTSTYIRNKEKQVAKLTECRIYQRYLMFQVQPDELLSTHSLRKQDEIVRESARYFQNTLCYTTVQLQVLISIVQVYFIYNLHNVAHGDACLSQKDTNDALLDEAGVKRIDIDCSNPEVENEYISVYRPGSSTVNKADRILDNQQKMRLYEAMLKQHSSKGNRGTNKSSVSIGFGQIQGDGIDDEIHGSIPSLFIEGEMFLNTLDSELKSALGALLEYFYKRLKVGSMSNPERSRVCSKYFVHPHWEGNAHRFEYINISLRKETDELAMHFDSKNDKREGYNGCTVYSYNCMMASSTV